MLSCAGVAFNVDWKAPAGSRAASLTIAGDPIGDDELYYVAATAGVARCSETIAEATPDTLHVWGSPADAMRSHIQRKN